MQKLSQASGNGVKIGDKISSFKEAFGNSVSDKNGDAHFKYKDIFLSVNYDTKTGQTYSVYILKNDFLKLSDELILLPGKFINRDGIN